MMRIKPIVKGVLFFCMVILGGSLFAQENCFNGIDDDGDGLIDLNDTEDCVCEGSQGDEIESIIPNPSFEEMDGCCPSSWSQLYCAQDWVQATNATSDFFHTCDYMPPCVPQPLPDGEGLVGAYFGAFNGGGTPWYEYVGSCLQSEMIAGEPYTMQFYISAIVTANFDECWPITQEQVDVTLFGLETCPDFPINTTSCPVPLGWTELGSVSYNPAEEWSVLTINFTPTNDLNAVMLGPPCDLDPDVFGAGPNSELLYCMFDGLILNESSLFSGIINQQGGNCLGDLILSTGVSDVFTYQWYHEGVALPGETDPVLNLGESGYEIGNYQVMVTNEEDATCSIAETTVSPAENSPVQFEGDVLSGCAPLEVNFSNLTDPAFIQSSQWNFEIGNSTDNDPTFTFNQAGVFDVTLTVLTPGNCVASVTLEDYIEVFPSEAPEITYTVLDNCPPYNVAFTSNAPASGTCVWDFGDLGVYNECEPVIVVNQEGTFSTTLDVSGLSECSEPGNLDFTVFPGNPPSFEITGPRSICPESTDSLLAIFENGSIEWTDGPAGAYLEITNPGWYYATFLRDDGCEAIDSIFIPEKLPPVIRAEDKEACEGDPVQLFADSDVSDVWWVDLSDQHVVMVYEAGIYIAEAENECGVTQKEVEVTLTDCDCHVYIPNSFSPNGDGINDLFKPSISCELQFYEILIFDRWGREVFKSNNPAEGWNGTTLENENYFPEAQIFNYIVRYDNALRPNSDRQEERGFVQLLR